MFAKVFNQIFDSSIAENHLTRLVFTDLLTLADANGVVDMTHEAIARRTNVPLETVRAAIAELEAPDPRSRTPDNEGRRIVRLDEHRDWGWLICNYSRFRHIANEEQRRAATRQRVAQHREAKRVTPCNAPVTHGNACNAMEKEKEKEKEKQEEHERESEAAAPPLNCHGLPNSPPVRQRSDSRELPSREQVKAYAVTIGLAEWRAMDAFDELEACGWLDFNARPVQKWQPVFTRIARKWEADGRPAGPPASKAYHQPNGSSSSSPVSDRILHEKELVRVEAELRRIAESYDSHADLTPAHRAERKRLKGRASELKALLGFAV